MNKYSSSYVRIISFIIFLLSVATLLFMPAFVQATPLPATLQNQNATPGPYAPLVIKDAPATPTGTLPIRETVFGIEMESVLVGGDKVSAAGTTWVRRNALVWNLIEPTEGERNWAAVKAMEQELIEAAKLNFKVILIVRGTPSWAQKYRGSECGPIKSDKFEAFGRFMRDVAKRYSVAPYNVRYWELGNEPDAPVVIKDNVWGCWGEPSDRYYGGRYYAQILKAAYPQIKAVDPGAQVLVGGLLLNCDPINPPRGADCRHSNFFEGILLETGGDYFDGVSYHSYDYYYGVPGQYGSDNWRSAWNTTGPLLITKGRFLRDVMKKYDVTGKFLMDTELALLCWDCKPADMDDYETAKAYYVAQGHAAAMAEGLKGVTWYSLFGWLGSGMVDAELQSKPVFTAYEVARAKIGAATFKGQITPDDVGGLLGVTGYKFRRADGKGELWLMWTLNGDTRTVTFSRAPSAITDVMGKPLTSAPSIALTIKPVYVEWSAGQDR